MTAREHAAQLGCAADDGLISAQAATDLLLRDHPELDRASAENLLAHHDDGAHLLWRLP